MAAAIVFDCPESIDRCREWLAAQRSRIYPAFGQNRRPAAGRSTAIGRAHAPARGSPMKTDRGMRRTPAGRRKSVITADPSARTPFRTSSGVWGQAVTLSSRHARHTRRKGLTHDNAITRVRDR